MRLDARDKLARAERLGHVVVRAETEAADLVDIVLSGGNHEDRDVTLFPDSLADLKAVHPRQHQVEHDQVKLFRERLVQSLPAVVLHLDLEIRELEIILFQFRDGFFVFDD